MFKKAKSAQTNLILKLSPLFPLYYGRGPTIKKLQSPIMASFNINGALNLIKDESGKATKIEGLLMNSRMVQGIFWWSKPDTVDNFTH